MNSLPKTSDLKLPLLTVLNGSGSLSNTQIRDSIIINLGLSAEQCRVMHSGNRTELEYRLAWARTLAKNDGLIESPRRMHWTITDKGKTFLAK